MCLDLKTTLAAANRNSDRNSGRSNNDQPRNSLPVRQQVVPTMNGQHTDSSANPGGKQGNGGRDGGQGNSGHIPGLQIS